MGIYQRGNIWWYKFKKEGRPYYKSSESTDPEEAQGLLRIAQGDVARGKTPVVIFNQVTLDDLAEDFLADWILAGWKSLSSELFAPPWRLNSGLKVLRKTTTSCSWQPFYQNLRVRATVRYSPSFYLCSDMRKISAILGNVKNRGKAPPFQEEGLSPRGG